jgi:hypothetical protein
MQVRIVTQAYDVPLSLWKWWDKSTTTYHKLDLLITLTETEVITIKNTDILNTTFYLPVRPPYFTSEQWVEFHKDHLLTGKRVLQINKKQEPYTITCVDAIELEGEEKDLRKALENLKRYITGEHKGPKDDTYEL